MYRKALRKRPILKPSGNDGIVGITAFSKLAKLVTLAIAVAKNKREKRKLPNNGELAKPLWNLLTNNRKVIYKYIRSIYVKNVIHSVVNKLRFLKHYIQFSTMFYRKNPLLVNKPNATYYGNNYALYLAFKRNRFFPYFYLNSNKDCIFNNSLGIVSKHFSLKKAFLRSKSSYIMSAIYLRRLFIHLGVEVSYLTVTKTPKFLKDILNTILSNANSFYQHPFTDKIVNEKQNNISIYFHYVNFINNKILGKVKTKKRGRLKRKISKRVHAYNSVLD